MSFTAFADTSGLDAYLDELGDAAEEAARPVAQAGIQVLYDQILSNVGALGTKTGNLKKSIYQVYSEKDSSQGVATYYTSWNHTKAPHGHLVENGFLQRYQYYKRPDGRIRPMVRPEMQGKPKPGRNAPQSVKDAYYVPRPGGPIQVPAKAFVRSAQSSFTAAMEAAKTELFRRLPLEG